MRRSAFVFFPLVSALSIFAVCAAPTEARADVTSWLSLGGGYGFAHEDVAKRTDRGGTLTTSIGVGSSPAGSFVVGGIARATVNLTLGTDISLGPRFATRGFARGDWGFAFDAGVVGRFWGSGDYGQFPLQAVVYGGAPWGLQIGVGATAWNLTGAPYAAGGFAILEIDLLRLTVMRQGSTESFWPNAAPAGGHLR